MGYVLTSKIGVMGFLLGMSLGCQPSKPDPAALALTRARTAMAVPVTVLPASNQIALGAITGIPAQASLAGRRDSILGSDYQPRLEIRRQSVDVRDDQRVINGRVQSNLLWRIRTFDQGR